MPIFLNTIWNSEEEYASIQDWRVKKSQFLPDTVFAGGEIAVTSFQNKLHEAKQLLNGRLVSAECRFETEFMGFLPLQELHQLGFKMDGTFSYVMKRDTWNIHIKADLEEQGCCLWIIQVELFQNILPSNVGLVLSKIVSSIHKGMCLERQVG